VGSALVDFADSVRRLGPGPVTHLGEASRSIAKAGVGICTVGAQVADRDIFPDAYAKLDSHILPAIFRTATFSPRYFAILDTQILDSRFWTGQRFWTSRGPFGEGALRQTACPRNWTPTFSPGRDLGHPDSGQQILDRTEILDITWAIW
jgi:hypothetical protein